MPHAQTEIRFVKYLPKYNYNFNNFLFKQALQVNVSSSLDK